MIERRVNPILALLSILILSTPAPASSRARSIMVANCLGGMVRIDLPTDPAQPTGDQCCAKGCHAASDRRKKGQDDEALCC
jgi:hypothetical protein